MKKETCPFCGHRWIRKRNELKVICPNCKKEYEPYEEVIDWEHLKTPSEEKIVEDDEL